MDDGKEAALPSLTLRISAGLIILFISAYGVLVNTYVFQSIRKNPKFSGSFYLLCISRSLSNFLNCFVFLIWAAPSTLLGFLYLPFAFNVLFGQLAGWGAYIAGVLVQWVMSANRFIVSYWPLYTPSTKYGVHISLTICWLIAIGFTVSGFPEGCAFIFSVELISWVPVDSPCAISHGDYLLFTIIAITAFSNTMNIATFFKIIFQIKKGSGNVSSSQSDLRQRKNRLMFAQSCTQDILHVIDMINALYVSKLNPEIWFQFLCLSVSFVGIHVLDGTVMIVFNREIQPKFCVRKRKQKSLGEIRKLIKRRQKTEKIK